MTQADITAILTATDPAALRRRAGFTLKTVAAATDVAWPTIWKWENRERTPTGERGAAYVRFVAGLARHEAVRVDAEEAEAA